MYSQPAPTAAIALLAVSLCRLPRWCCSCKYEVARLADMPTCRVPCTYMMQIQSNMYDATSFVDGTPMPRMVLMFASEW